MRLKRTLALASTAALLAVVGCSGGSGDTTEVEKLSQAGVPPNAETFPMPEAGVAYNNPQPRSAIQDGGTLTLPIDTLGPNFNGWNVDGNSSYNSELMMWLAPQLWTYSVTGEPEPNEDFLLSAELVDKSPQTVKYTMNPEAKWNDGTPIDWRSFKATWITQRGTTNKYNPAASAGYSSIGSVKKGAKNNEVIVTFKEDFYPWQLVFPSLEHPKNTDPEFYKSGWINEIHNDLLAGPFIVDELNKDSLTMKPNPKWWGDDPKLDAVEYLQMEPSASINAFVNGQIDQVDVESEDRLKQVQDMDDVRVRRSFDKAVTVYTFGQDSKLFKDRAARKAFVIGTDREQLAEIEFQGLDWNEELPGSALIYPWQKPYYEDNLGELGEYDPEKAKQILEDAGWEMGDSGYREKDGQVAEFTYVLFGDDPIDQAQARAQQQMAEKIGLKLNIDSRPTADFSKTLAERTFDVVKMGWSGTDPYGWAWACQIYCSDSPSNYSTLGNAKLDKMLQEPGSIPDSKKAAAASNEAEAEALQLIGTFPLYNGPKMEVAKEGLANYAGTTNGGLAGFHLPHPEDIGWEK